MPCICDTRKLSLDDKLRFAELSPCCWEVMTTADAFSREYAVDEDQGSASVYPFRVYLISATGKLKYSSVSIRLILIATFDSVLALSMIGEAKSSKTSKA